MISLLLALEPLRNHPSTLLNAFLTAKHLDKWRLPTLDLEYSLFSSFFSLVKWKKGEILHSYLALPSFNVIRRANEGSVFMKIKIFPFIYFSISNKSLCAVLSSMENLCWKRDIVAIVRIGDSLCVPLALTSLLFAWRIKLVWIVDKYAQRMCRM